MRLTVTVLLAACVFAAATVSASADPLIGWGGNGDGQIDVPAGDDFVAVDAGAYHSIALRSDGSLAGWGANEYGQADVPPGNDFVAISTQAWWNLALRSDGSLVAWGMDWYGATWVPEGNDYIAISAGGYHGLALRSDGSIVGWGNNDYGQIDVPQGNGFRAIAAGEHYSIAIASDGSLVGWGDNNPEYGQINVPVGNDFTAVAAGWKHCIALRSDGSLAGWGWNEYGQAWVPPDGNYVAIAASWVASMAQRSDGSLIAWGPGWWGQTLVPSGQGFTSLSLGGCHSLAVGFGVYDINVSVGHTRAVVSWQSNFPSSSVVEYGLTSDYGCIATGMEGKLHKVSFSVEPDQLYHFRVVSTDAAGHSAVSQDDTFWSSAEPIPSISNVIGVATSLNTATITWTTDVPTPGDDVVDVGTTSQYGLNIRSWLAVPTTRHGINLPGLLPNTTYHFRVSSAGCKPTGDYTFRTGSQMISNVSAKSTGQSTARITWQTNVPSNSMVEYGLTPNYTNSPSLGTLTTTHQVDISGLWAGTLYHYRVRSTDGSGNTAFSDDRTFVTDPPTFMDDGWAFTRYSLVKDGNGRYLVDLGILNVECLLSSDVWLCAESLGTAPALSPGLLHFLTVYPGSEERRVPLVFPESAGQSGSSVWLGWCLYDIEPFAIGNLTWVHTWKWRVTLP